MQVVPLRGDEYVEKRILRINLIEVYKDRNFLLDG